MECLFCKIVNRNIPADIVYENKKILAFKDINPLAPVHILIIPKNHIPSIADIKEKDIKLIGEMIFIAKKIADNFGISEGGYKLLFRVHRHGGQVIEHVHLHLIGGAPLFEDIHPINKSESQNKGENN